jgi:excisionase family DNA binding protein
MMMTRNDGQNYSGEAIRRHVLENIPEDPAVDYIQLRRKTGITEADLDQALVDLENLGVINTKKSANGVLYWRAGSGPDKEWYSVDDAARYLSVSKRTVQQLIRDGEMVAYRVGRGGHRRIRRTDLDGPMHREDHSGIVELAGAEDPVLSELWDNEQDAAYDRI